MKVNTLISKLNVVSIIVTALFLFSGSINLYAGTCCSGHGGVASCNKSTDYKQMCQDKTVSPSCTCAPKTKVVPAIKKTTPVKKETPTTNTETKSKSYWWGGKSKPSKAPPAKKGTSAKGCCSSHQGVAQCNNSTGYLMCKDGSQSPGCLCP